MSGLQLSEILAARRADLEAAGVVPAPEAPVVEEPQAFPHTDTGNCDRFVLYHGPDLRWCSEQEQWFCWDGKQWISAAGAAERVFRTTKHMVRDMYREALLLTDDKQRESLKKWAHTSESIKARKNIVEGSKSELEVKSSAFDANGWDLNTLDGILDLKSGVMRPHDRNAFCSKMAPVHHDPAAKAPKWQAFLERFQPDPEKRAFLQRFMGYCATGRIDEHVFVIFLGEGRNGKGTFVNTMLKVLGDYGRQVPTELLIERKGQQNHLEKVTLFGVRFAAASETEEGDALATALMKNITGGDKISARYQRHNFFDFVPTHKLVLSTQHLPQVKETKMAIWARIRVVSWDVEIVEGDQIGSYEEILFEEAPGILNWLIEGAQEHQRIGLAPPDSVMHANSEYRDSEDTVGQFLEAAVDIAPANVVPITDLRAAYDVWSQSVGEHPLKGRTWNARLRTRGFEQKTARIGKAGSDEYGKPTRCWAGLSLKGQTKIGALEVVGSEKPGVKT